MHDKAHSRQGAYTTRRMHDTAHARQGTYTTRRMHDTAHARKGACTTRRIHEKAHTRKAHARKCACMTRGGVCQEASEMRSQARVFCWLPRALGCWSATSCLSTCVPARRLVAGVLKQYLRTKRRVGRMRRRVWRRGDAMRMHRRRHGVSRVNTGLTH